MRISVVIPVINECQVIAQAIESAWSASVDEVIVVDGGSTDGTIDRVVDCRCHLVRSMAGRAQQMNRGAQATSGDVLLFLHADSRLDPDVGRQIREGVQPTQVQYGGFAQQIDNRRLVFRLIECGNQFRARWQRLVYGDQAQFFTRPAWLGYGPYPQIPLMEDYELSRRMGRLTHPILLPGPVFISARRWEQYGPVRQTIRNWSICARYRLGVPVEHLARAYRRHDAGQ